MKTAAVFRVTLVLGIALALMFSPLSTPRPARAEAGDDAASSEKFSREELAQMLAPIALYPDTLLTQVLMASTYPIEVVEADRWVRKNSGLKDETLDDALLDRDWDPSVKAVCHFPSVLALMSERIAETTDIGNAFLAQEPEVMGMVQELRAKAQAQNNLVTNAEQKVIVQRDTIIIEPADPRVIYVPYYDPFRVYGSWWYPAYPPYYWGPPGVSVGLGVSYWPGFYFGFAFGTWSYFDWHHRYIHIDVHKRPRFVRHDHWAPPPGRWDHTPRHRRGVAYHDDFTARRFGAPPPRAVDSRHDRRRSSDVRNLDEDRRDNERNRSDRTRKTREGTEIQGKKPKRDDLDRRDLQRVDSERRNREGIETNRRDQRRIDVDERESEPIESAQPERNQIIPVQQEQLTVEPTRRSEPIEGDRPEWQRGNFDRRRRELIESAQPERNQIIPVQQEQPTVDSARQQLEQIERDSARQPFDRTEQRSERAERNRQKQVVSDSVQQEQTQQILNPAGVASEVVEPARQPRTRDNFLNRDEESAKPRSSNERGRGKRWDKEDETETLIDSEGNQRGRGWR